MGNFDALEVTAKAFCGDNNEVIYDDNGMPSVMVKIPKFSLKDVGISSSNNLFPAFIADSYELSGAFDAIYISKFMNCVSNRIAYSMPGQNYTDHLAFDDAVSACTVKNVDRWHLMTRLEWMALVFLAEHNKTLPKGNNNYGKDNSENVYFAIPITSNAAGKTMHVASGSGPVTWSHNHKMSGIFDLKGNGWEYIHGIRFVYGELQILSFVQAESELPIILNNSAAMIQSYPPGLPYPGYSGPYPQWCAIDGVTGNLVPVSNMTGTTANCLRLDYRNNRWTWVKDELQNKSMIVRETTLNSITQSNVFANAMDVLSALGFYAPNVHEKVRLVNGIPEAVVACGGSYSDTGFGMYSFDITTPRNSSSKADYSFRSAYLDKSLL